MGVARLLRSRYGSEPQIDIEQQWARARVPAPVTFDLPSLDTGFEKNNYTLDRVRVRTDVAVRDDEVRIVATGQTFRLRGEAATGEGLRWLRFHDWKDPAAAAVEVEPPIDPAGASTER